MAGKKGNGAATPLSAVEKLRAKFAAFLAANPASALDEVGRKAGKRAEILKPWGDPSLGIHIPPAGKPQNDLAAALNPVVLHPRLSAIYHTDLKQIEVIWTALPLADRNLEINGRKFVFDYKNKKHNCEFKGSSDRLLKIAEHTYPKTNSLTNFRNIQSYSNYVTFTQAKIENPGVPLSFWIDNIAWDDRKTIEILENLNFYMTYYDANSPFVTIHDADIMISERPSKVRYIHGAFPKEILALSLDENLINFWVGARELNAVIRFMMYYRIIEYASAEYIGEAVKSELKRLLLKPHRNTDVPGLINEIAVVARLIPGSDPRHWEDLKTKGTIGNACDVTVLWKEIEANKNSFTKDVTLDGNFKIGKLISDTDTLETFKNGGVDKVYSALKKIRNALSHGRDFETAGVITPTYRNMHLLAPWVCLIETVAGSVVLHQSAP